jgi:beta-lactamase class D
MPRPEPCPVLLVLLTLLLAPVLFLEGLRRGTLPFRARAHDVVRQIMVVERAASHTLRAKTGWARGDWGSTGWWVGWVERGDDAWVFATVLDSTDPRADFGGQRQEVTRTVLRELGALPAATSSPPGP